MLILTFLILAENLIDSAMLKLFLYLLFLVFIQITITF